MKNGHTSLSSVTYALMHATSQAVKSAAGRFASQAPQLLPSMHRTPSKLFTPYNLGTHRAVEA